ncbi:MAG: hypothetical protein HY721_33850 [Planctomycetes bacterium]|nr:hypothetical protein [Planctomycetota bacterium]
MAVAGGVALASLLAPVAYGHDLFGEPGYGEGIFIRGDSNLDRQVDLSDAVHTLTYLFLGQDDLAPNYCLDAHDYNDSGDVDISDPIASLSHLFLGAGPPAAPYPAPGRDPTYDLLYCEPFGQVQKIFRESCLGSACHSASSGAGELVLEGNRPYADLVGKPAVYSTSSLLRVKPGDPDGSFLIRKLEGNLATGEGEPMPHGRGVLPSAKVRFIRHWIEDGAIPSGPDDINLPVPPPPGHTDASGRLDGGVQVRVPPFQVPTERIRSFYVRLPNASELWVNRYEFLYPPGSHHFNLFSANRPDVQVTCNPPPGPQSPPCSLDTFDFIDPMDWSLCGASQSERLTWRLPPGVAIRFRPQQLFLAQSHFVDAGPQAAPIQGVAVVNMFEAPQDGRSPLFGAFILDKNVFIPGRGQPAGFSTHFDFGLKLATLGYKGKVKLAAITGHFHWRGRSIEIRRWNGQRADAVGRPEVDADGRTALDWETSTETIYISDNWDEPPFQTWEGDGPELDADAGEGIIYRSTYELRSGDAGYDFPFGTHTPSQEHSNVFLYFYTDQPQTKEASENTVFAPPPRVCGGDGQNCCPPEAGSPTCETGLYCDLDGCCPAGERCARPLPQ